MVLPLTPPAIRNIYALIIKGQERAYTCAFINSSGLHASHLGSGLNNMLLCKLSSRLGTSALYQEKTESYY